MFGLLNVNKSAGMTSRDVVNRVQRIVRPSKAGHAGTLDPLAEGVLVICIGAATRLIQYVQQMPKRYTGTFLLGRQSDTEDVEGEVIELVDPPQPSPAEIENVLPQFIGTIQQRPPAYSALKVGGRRAYDLARAGQLVELEPRPITITDIRLVKYEYPELVLDVTCGSGTYIRSLGRDIAEALGTAAVMSALTRTAIGEFRLEQACRLDQLTAESIAEHLLPPLTAVAALPQIQLNDDEARRLGNGLTIADRFDLKDNEIAAIDADGHLRAIVTRRDAGQLKPLRNFPLP